MRIHAHGSTISSVDDWFRLAPPKGREAHWRDGRSALELARACCPAPGASEVPDEVRALLESHPMTAGLSRSDAEGSPELRVRIDAYAGEPRNTDLAFVYSAPAPTPRIVAVSVEAKADESLGQHVKSTVAGAERRRALGKSSNADRRARELAAALFGLRAAADPRVGDLRYQLLTATAGALAFAQTRGAAVAVLVLFEFVDRAGRHTSTSKLATNARDMDVFVTHLTSGRCTSLEPGALIGPFFVPGNAHLPSDIPLLIGKTRRVLG